MTDDLNLQPVTTGDAADLVSRLIGAGLSTLDAVDVEAGAARPFTVRSEEAQGAGPLVFLGLPSGAEVRLMVVGLGPPAAVPALELVPARIVADLLSLVAADLPGPVDLADVEAWAPADRAAAAEWAARAHLSASDHDDVEVGPLPQVLADLAGVDVEEEPDGS